jgi:cytoskeletal protein CcmA (bactofilin family)
MARDIKEGRLSGFVGHGTTLTGETEFHAMLRVDGHLIGTVSSEAGTLIIGTNGQVDANIMVAAAMINGTVNGDIVASEKLQLGRTARVMGNIHSPRLIIEEGAILEGSCSMLKARETQEEEAVAAAAQYEEPEIVMLANDDKEIDDSAAYLADDDDDDENGICRCSGCLSYQKAKTVVVKRRVFSPFRLCTGFIRYILFPLKLHRVKFKEREG